MCLSYVTPAAAPEVHGITSASLVWITWVHPEFTNDIKCTCLSNWIKHKTVHKGVWIACGIAGRTPKYQLKLRPLAILSCCCVPLSHLHMQNSMDWPNASKCEMMIIKRKNVSWMHHKILMFRIWSVLCGCPLSLSMTCTVESLFLKTKELSEVCSWSLCHFLSS